MGTELQVCRCCCYHCSTSYSCFFFPISFSVSFTASGVVFTFVVAFTSTGCGGGGCGGSGSCISGPGNEVSVGVAERGYSEVVVALGGSNERGR